MEIDARARRPLDIRTVRIGDDQIQVEERALVTLPFARLTSFTSTRSNWRQVLIVPPIAGAFAILLRDLVVALLRHGCDVAIVDWHDDCYIPVSAGRFGHQESVLYVRDMICMLGKGAHVVAVCQGVVPAFAATALLSQDELDKAPRSLVLIGGPVDPWSNPTYVVKALRARTLSWFEENVIEKVPSGYPGEGRLVYPKSVQFWGLMTYVGRH